MVIVPPVPDELIPLPFWSAAKTGAIVTGTGPLGSPVAIEKVAVATTPLPITLLFIPSTTQSVVLAVLKQVRVLPAAVVALPGVTLTPVTADEL
jgi:hypothetical protein